MKSAGEHVPAPNHLGSIHPVGHGIPRILSEFELNGLAGLALDDRSALANPLAAEKVVHFEAD